jgi:hypothetical protein
MLVARLALPLLLGLALASPTRAEGFLCRGDDPGRWELGSEGGGAVLRPDRGNRRSFTGTATSLPAEGITVWRGRSREDGGDLVAVMIKGTCMDTDGGPAGSHAAVISLPGARVLVGCCRLGGAVGGKAEPSAKSAEERSLAVGEKVLLRGAPGERVNVRSQAGTKGSKVVARLAGGSEVTVAEARRQEGRAWYRITAASLEEPGWIRGDMLVPPPVDSAASAPAITPEPAPSASAASAPTAATAEVMPAAAASATSAEPPAEDWSRRVLDLMPAIRACLDATPDKPATITKAWPMNRGMVGVRLRDAKGTRSECIVAAGGGAPERHQPVDATSRPLPGEGRPVFTPAPQVPPAGPCWRNEPVTGPGGGESPGTLSYIAC